MGPSSGTAFPLRRSQGACVLSYLCLCRWLGEHPVLKGALVPWTAHSLVIEHAGHADSLLLAPRQNVLPVTYGLPTWAGDKGTLFTSTKAQAQARWGWWACWEGLGHE